MAWFANCARPSLSRSAKRQYAERKHCSAMATAVCGSATRAASEEFCGFVKIKPVGGRSPPNAKRRTPITSHSVPYLTGLNRRRDFESPQVAARVPPPEFEHAVTLVFLPAKSAPFADQ